MKNVKKNYIKYPKILKKIYLRIILTQKKRKSLDLNIKSILLNMILEKKL